MSYISKKDLLEILRELDAASLPKDGPTAMYVKYNNKSILVTIGIGNDTLTARVGKYFKLAYTYSIEEFGG